MTPQNVWNVPRATSNLDAKGKDISPKEVRLSFAIGSRLPHMSIRFLHIPMQIYQVRNTRFWWAKPINKRTTLNADRYVVNFVTGGITTAYIKTRKSHTELKKWNIRTFSVFLNWLPIHEHHTLRVTEHEGSMDKAGTRKKDCEYGQLLMFWVKQNYSRHRERGHAKFYNLLPIHQHHTLGCIGSREDADRLIGSYSESLFTCFLSFLG